MQNYVVIDLLLHAFWAISKEESHQNIDDDHNCTFPKEKVKD
jgi:hypothetical protein